jgi:hypothetical protein
MDINDLSYLEDIRERNIIEGGLLVGVDAAALALGDATATFVDTTTNIKELGNGGFMGKGTGTAIAIGEITIATVNLYGVGDSVRIKTKEKYFPHKDMLIVRGTVKVKDKP